MKERGILFSAPMVRALLAGTKTQTRRIIKPCPFVTISDSAGWVWESPTGGYGGLVYRSADGTTSVPARCPYGSVGDRLWVRETWQPIWADGVERTPVIDSPDGWAVSYPATDGFREYKDPDRGLTTRCKPGIHMPRWASRITLDIVDVRVQRLHDITDDDARAEGVEKFFAQFPNIGRDQRIADGRYARDEEYRASFACLWDEINGDTALWVTNPWVWAVTFKRVETTS